MSKNTPVYLFAIVAIMAIILLLIFPVNCNNQCDNYAKGKRKDMCICGGLGKKFCANKDELIASYDKGNNESKNFAKIQQSGGGSCWRDTNFDKY